MSYCWAKGPLQHNAQTKPMCQSITEVIFCVFRIIINCVPKAIAYSNNGNRKKLRETKKVVRKRTVF